MRYFYRNEEGAGPWLEAAPNQINEIRRKEAPAFVTWTATDYEEGDQGRAIYEATFLPIDIDAKDDLPRAIEAARSVRMKLIDWIGDDANACELYASGGKGFHVLMPAALFGEPVLRHVLLPQAAKSVAQRFAVPEIDLTLYVRGRGKMLREPGVQRANNAFKVPLQWSELETLTVDGYRELVSRPRLREGSSVAVRGNQVMCTLWSDCVASAQRAEEERKARVMAIEAQEGKVDSFFRVRVQCALDWLATNHGSDFAGYVEWKSVLLALHPAGMEAAARAFSQRVPGWDERAFESQWAAIEDDARDLLNPGSVLHAAHQRGWRELEVLEAIRPEIQSTLEAGRTDAGALLGDEFVQTLRYLERWHAGELARVHDHPAMKGRKRTVARKVREVAEAESTSRNETPLSRAKRILARLGGDDLLFTGSEFWRYDGSHWTPLDSDQLVRQAIHDDFGTANFTSGVVGDIVRLIETEAFRDGVRFDRREGEVVALQNGELALIDGQWVLRPHCRESRLTSLVPHSWKPDASCPRFTAFLDSVFAGDLDAREKAALVFEMIGASLVPTTRFERGVLLLGRKGRNGKSTLLKVLEHTIGTPNVSSVPVGKLGDRFNLCALRSKLVNISAEIGPQEGIPEAVVKSITSGDLLHAEFKGRDGFSFSPFCKLWVGANVLPAQRDYTPALLRRFEIVGFNRSFVPGRDENKNLANELKQEVEGIIVAGLNAYAAAVARGELTIPPSSDELKKGWKLDNDPVADYAVDRLVLWVDAHPEDRAGSKESWFLSTDALLLDYERWATGKRMPFAISEKTLAARLEQLDGVERCRKMVDGHRARGFTGLMFALW